MDLDRDRCIPMDMLVILVVTYPYWCFVSDHSDMEVLNESREIEDQNQRGAFRGS